VGSKERRKRIPGLGLLAAAGILLTGCQEQLPLSLLDPQGPVARMQSGLLQLSLYVAIGIGLFVSIALLYVVFRFRARGDLSHVPKQIQGNTALEIIWTLIPVIILAFVAVPTVRAAFATDKPPAEAKEVIRAIGHQWWFAFEYPNAGFTTASEMVIPVGEPILVELTSNDVIHSFWVPKLAGKMDAMPGRVNRMWLLAEEEGIYYGQCAEFCGTNHAEMRFRVLAVSREEYDAWIRERQAGAKEPTDPVALAGKALFEGEGNRTACFTCHTIDGSTKATGTVGPNLSNIGARATIASALENNAENLRAWILDPQSIKPEVNMTGHPNLTEEELEALITYLQSLK